MLTDHTNVMVKKKDCQIRHLPLDKSHFITEIGTKIKLVDDNGTTIEGTILSFELSQYDEQDDMLHLIVNNQEYYSIGVTHVVDIEEL